MATRREQTEETRNARADHPPRHGFGQESGDFENLLSDFSSALIRVSVAEIDNEIERWLEQIVLALVELTRIERATS